VEKPVFTGRELDIMSVIWRRGSGSVAEVRGALGDSVAYTTVLKINWCRIRTSLRRS
jgi:predicted transcriptional regulator